MSNKNICVIQLTRTGDIIQTCQAVHAAKLENPNFKFTLVARKTYLKGLEFITDQIFEKTHTLDTKEVFEGNNLVGSSKSISSLITNINQGDFDLVVNLSYSNTSAYLTSLIKGKSKAGIMMNRQNLVEVNDTWSQFVYATILNGQYCPFNLVDIFKKVIGVNSFTNVFTENENPKDQIVIHPFASQRKKSWGHSKWIEVIYQLLKNNQELDVILVGAPNEQEESQLMASSKILLKYQSRIKNYVGKTTIEQTFQIVRES